MKKLIAFLLVLVMMLCVAACAPAQTPDAPASTAMTHAEFLAAAQDEAIEVECYVQATQSWYNNAIKIYAQDKTGGYIGYDIPCTEEQAAKLVPGTKINIKGYKAYWDGMPEIGAEGAVLTIIEGADTYVAEATDMTDLLGKAELVEKTGMLAAFKGLTIAAINYKNNEPGDDIYVDVTLGDATYSFCVERYLTDPDTEVYKAFADLKAGDKVDIEGFVYWWDPDGSKGGNGINTHITKVTKAG